MSPISVGLQLPSYTNAKKAEVVSSKKAVSDHEICEIACIPGLQKANFTDTNF